MSNTRTPVNKIGLACPECGHTISYVKDSHATDVYVRRRRECRRCGERFTSYETHVGEPEMTKLMRLLRQASAEASKLHARRSGRNVRGMMG